MSAVQRDGCLLGCPKQIPDTSPTSSLLIVMSHLRGLRNRLNSPEITNQEVSILSWNIDFMRILPNARMKAALAHLRSLVEGETQRSIIMLNEMVMSDLNLIQSADWIQRGYRQVFRVHYDATNMGRDALFVDIDLPQDKTFRICSTHLESLVADPPMRPDQLAQAAKFMHEAGASVLGGDLNAIQPFDKTLHLDNNLKDAYLESGGEEDAESGMTWGQMASTWQRGKFGLTRMDKMLYCGGLELIGFERFGMDVESLVSEFIINPVLRQARRFSSGFATNESVSMNAAQHHRTRSMGVEADSGIGNAIFEVEEDRGVALDVDPEPRHLIVRPAAANVDQVAQTAVPSYGNLALRSIDDVPPTEDHVLRPTLVPDNGSEPPQWTTTTPIGTPSGRNQDSTLPEDDGMGPLRRRIHEIQSQDIPQGEKAQLVHQALLEGYTKSRFSISPSEAALKLGASPTTNYVVPDTSRTLQQALKSWNPLGDGSGPLALPLSEEDRRPTYVPVSPADQAGLGEQHEAEENGQPALLGCQHYRRNVKLQCATCEKWYTCRFCHDAVEDHVLPRKETKNMLCMLCGCPQRASDTCIQCGETAAHYYCGVCKLWNDDPNKAIYHCNDCGLCRVGQGLGKDFFHCKKCSACISVGSTVHKCIERSIDCDCPICGEYMFNSPRPVVFMKCGHSIHRHCFNEHMQTSYKCPLCNKSCVNMEYQFRNFDIAILTQPMPVEYRDARAIVSCNDCSAKSQTAYHWLGLKCTVCHSYNTVQLQLLNMPGDATTPQAMAREEAITSAREQPRHMSGEAARILAEMRRAHEEAVAVAAAAGAVVIPPENGEPSSVGPPPLATGIYAAPADPAAPHAADATSTAAAPAPAAPAAAAPAAAATTESVINPSVVLVTSPELSWLPPTSGVGETDDSEEEDMLDFWGSDAGYIRRNLTSADGNGDEEDDDDEDDDDDESSADECDVDTDEEEDANEIVLFGHR
ncbi:hypothetical protein B0H66DRAFT_583707 [Apodospora peruviana]|uniref:Uncharacterized protein n=1 Tax=Apodospora peruviana TaxID=516989 RepID=A0AAE0HXW9_9PEZI|nr:hypothetical protein B0H66DRAFT_583707 [Apodospora peruviana]